MTLDFGVAAVAIFARGLALNDVPQAQYPEGSSRICQHAAEKNSGELEVEGKHLVLLAPWTAR